MGASSSFLIPAAMVVGSAALIAGTGGAAAVPLGAGLGAGVGGTTFGVGAAGLSASTVAAGVGAAGGLLGAYGALQEGSAQADMAKYQVQVAKNNQTLAEAAARDAKVRGEQDVAVQRMRTKQAVGNYRASAAGRGVEVDSGSALDTAVDIAGVGELDALLIRDNATREALGFQNQSLEFQGEQSLYKASARNAKKSSYINATSTLLTSGTNVASRWYQQ